MSAGRSEEEKSKIVPLLQQSASSTLEEDQSLTRRVLAESKKLWRIVGPSIVGRLASYSMFVVSQAFAGHLGDLELAGMSIAISVITAFDKGLMLGMGSALETLCGQAFGAKKYNMMGVYLQRSWIILSLSGLFTLPLYIFAFPILKFLGQPDDVAQVSGTVALYLIPLHLSYTLLFPLQTFLQSQLKNYVTATVNVGAFATHLVLSWLLVSKFEMGLIGILVALNISWWLILLGLFAYTIGGGCPLSWNGFSFDAFSGLWDFTKLSLSSGVMLCLELWYYRILVLMTGNLPNAKIELDALAICMYINGWEIMIPMGFLTGTG